MNLNPLSKIRCLFGYHDLRIVKSIRGSYGDPRWVGIVKCLRCGRRFVMSEYHQAFLRCDNDPKMQEDLLFMYGTTDKLDVENPLRVEDMRP